ncbi:MAG: DUF423 domain-containing protein [Bacilli bacterium]|nr:DUF423 domain-containing protein [Bacilli bacterium]
MKKIKARLLKARSIVSIKTYKRPMLFVIMLMVLINIIILCVAAVIALFIDDSYSGFIDAFANGSLKWLLTPNAVLDIENPNTLFLAAIVLVVGMVLFSGTIIALTTNLIKEYFQKKKSGSGKIFLSNHIVILNWNNKVPELVADLLNVEDADVTLMILADVEKEYAEKQIFNAVYKMGKSSKELSNLNVLVKKGDPLVASDLSDISIEEAITVIIMNKGTYEEVTKDMSKSDLNVIKTILNIGRIDFNNNPPIVAEIKRIETKEKIFTMARVVETLKGHTLLPICFDRRLGQIIAQTIIHNLMEDVYLSLFSFEGSEVYNLKNTTFEECLNRYSDAVPLARNGEDLFVLSLDNKKMHKTSNAEIEVKSLKTIHFQEVTNQEVYLIGKNNKLEFIQSAFNEYKQLYNTDFSSKWISDNEIDSFIDEINESHNPITIVLLSDENQIDDSLDANVINSLIYLEGRITRKDVNIIVELLDPKNDSIIKDFNINNTIISNKIISLLLSKLALIEDTGSFYESLLTFSIDGDEDDQEIIIKKANEMFNEKFPLQFSNKKSFIVSTYESFQKKIIPFGYFRDNVLHILSEELHKNEDFKIQETDFIVLMKI